MKIALLVFLFIGVLMAKNIDYMEIENKKIPIILEKSSSIPIIQLDIFFKSAGNIGDTIPSTSQFVARVLNEGSSKKPFGAFHNELEQRAINFSISSNRETMTFSISCLKEEFPYATKLLKELLMYPNITKKSFEKVSLMLKSSILEHQEDFDSLASNQLNKMIFKDTVFEEPSTGTLDSIKKIKPAIIKKFIKENITLSNTMIILGGDFDDDSILKIKNAIKHLPVGKSKKITKIIPSMNTKYKKIIKDTKQAYIYFASPLNIEVDDKEGYKAKVASFILGSSGFGSRLMEKIRVEKALAYSVYAYVDISKSYSIMQGYMQTKTDKEKEAIDIIKDEIGKFVKSGVNKKELDSAKKFILGSEPLRNETMSQRLSQRFNEYYRNLGENSQKRFLEDVEKLTLKELNDFIKKHNEILDLSFSVVTDK